MQNKNYERIRIRCPHPDHEDSTPSADIRVYKNGSAYWYCWGCNRKGRAEVKSEKIITVYIDGKPKDINVKDARRHVASGNGLSDRLLSLLDEGISLLSNYETFTESLLSLPNKKPFIDMLINKQIDPDLLREFEDNEHPLPVRVSPFGFFFEVFMARHTRALQKVTVDRPTRQGFQIRPINKNSKSKYLFVAHPIAIPETYYCYVLRPVSIYSTIPVFLVESPFHILKYAAMIRAIKRGDIQSNAYVSEAIKETVMLAVFGVGKMETFAKMFNKPKVVIDPYTKNALPRATMLDVDTISLDAMKRLIVQSYSERCQNITPSFFRLT